MKNKFKIFLRYLLLFIFIFVILNILIVFLWPIKTAIKFSNYEPYSEIELKSLNLNKSEGLKLYLETWQRQRLYEYDEYTGIVESDSINNNFVNLTKEFGRKISNKNCTRRIFFYGGENMFGYNVTDTQTIPHYFKEIIAIKPINKQEYCIYNFGRGTYNSTQENILFIKHILNSKISNKDIVIFLDGINEKGNNEILNTKFISQNYDGLHQKYWLLYKYTFISFMRTIPSSQVLELILKKNNVGEVNKDKIKINEFDVKKVFDDNIKIRSSICNKFELNCFNFLQPFPGLHGKFYNKINSKIETYYNKNNLELYQNYFLLNKTENVINISDSLNDSLGISYINEIYYSPESNKLIAQRIYNSVKDNIN